MKNTQVPPLYWMRGFSSAVEIDVDVLCDTRIYPCQTWMMWEPGHTFAVVVGRKKKCFYPVYPDSWTKQTNISIFLGWLRVSSDRHGTQFTDRRR